MPRRAVQTVLLVEIKNKQLYIYDRSAGIWDLERFYGLLDQENIVPVVVFPGDYYSIGMGFHILLQEKDDSLYISVYGRKNKTKKNYEQVLTNGFYFLNHQEIVSFTEVFSILEWEAILHEYPTDFQKYIVERTALIPIGANMLTRWLTHSAYVSRQNRILEVIKESKRLGFHLDENFYLETFETDLEYLGDGNFKDLYELQTLYIHRWNSGLIASVVRGIYKKWENSSLIR